MTEEHFNALPPGYELFEYQVKSVLGHGGFGITYLAWDTNLEKEVAIKEYLPAEFAVRQGEQTVRPRSTGDEEDYKWGLDRFVKEAQTLALFRHPSIVPVYRFFKANGTAYMVMEYQKGDALTGLMSKHRGEFTEEDLLSLVLPLLDGLSAVHKAGYLHRDVKPGNIFIREDGSPVLLDFGAARDAVGRKSKSLTSIVTPGYAPLEQYFADGNQGPWTDIYALAAILYQAVTGKVPPEAPARVKKDPIKPCAEVNFGRFSDHFVAAIDRALAVEEELRPQTTEEWRAMLEGQIPATAEGAVDGPSEGATLMAGGQRITTPIDVDPTGRPAAAHGSGRWGLVAAIVAGVVVVAGAATAGFVYRDDIGRMFASSSTGTDNGTRISDEERRRAEAEAAKRKQENDERLRREAEQRRQAELERKRREDERKRLEDERRRQEAARREAARKRSEEARRSEEIRRSEEDRREAERKRREDERKRAEEADRRLEAERKRAEEDARKREAERKRREELAKREEELRKRREEAERRRREEARKRRELASRTTTVRCGRSLSRLNGMYASQRDCALVGRVLNVTLRMPRSGVTNRWRNRATGTTGTVTVLETIRRPDGTYCRRFRQTVTSQGRTRKAVGTACLLNNRWRISG